MLNRELVLKNLGQCARCRQCRMVCEVPIAQTMLPVCPSGEYFKFDTYFGSGRVTLAKKLLLGTVELDQSIVNATYACCLCGSCKQQCPIINFDPLEATIVTREMIVEKGMADAYPMPDTTFIATQIDEDQASETVLFVGTEAQSDAHTVESIASVLKRCGVALRALTGVDCGEYLLRKGDTPSFERKKAENTALFKKMGIKKIIAHDPMTYKVLKQDYGLATQGIETVFYLELVEGNLEKKPGKGTKAAYHDSSYLGRYMGVYDLPRRVIAELGYELVEMVRTRENAMSSGAYPDYIKSVADMSSAVILGEARDAGAEVLITADRNSEKQLKETAMSLGLSIEVQNIANLL